MLLFNSSSLKKGLISSRDAEVIVPSAFFFEVIFGANGILLSMNTSHNVASLLVKDCKIFQKIRKMKYV